MKPEDKDLGNECDGCGKIIPNGKAYVCITKSIEQVEHNIATNEEEIEVISDEALLTFCGSCGNKFDDELLVSIIRNFPVFRNQKNNWNCPQSHPVSLTPPPPAAIVVRF